MQEVGGSIPPGSTSLRPSRLRWQPAAHVAKSEAARRSPKGEDGLHRHTLPSTTGERAMKYVYILRSLDSLTRNMSASRTICAPTPKHNAGECPTPPNSSRGAGLVLRFPDKQAVAFEKYLKSHRAAPSRRSASTPYSPITAFNRSRSATISSFIATSSDTVQSDAARIDCGTLRALSFSAWPCAVSAIRT